MADEAILAVRGLSRYFRLDRHTVIKAVDDVTFELGRGEIFGLVGESGSGKSTLGRVVIGLYRPMTGTADYRGGGMQMIFQDSAAAMNPRMTAGQIIAEPLVLLRRGNRARRRERVLELLALVGLPADCIDRFPVDFSGGQQQRVCIARALAPEPDLVIADEPAAALDVSLRAQTAALFRKLQRERGTSFLFIAHDLALVRQISDHVGVMRAGRLVEQGETRRIFEAPAHPYTRELLACIPSPDPDFKTPGAFHSD